jgi:transposase
MTINLEIGDISRFDHPSPLTSFSGMDISEYSSGGKERKYHITKMGNRRLRTAVIEAAQFAIRSPRVSQDLRNRRKDAPYKSIETADRCMNRLYKKANRLKYRGKETNKIKVACAREMLGFIWESLKNVA